MVLDVAHRLHAVASIAFVGMVFKQALPFLNKACRFVRRDDIFMGLLNDIEPDL